MASSEYRSGYGQAKADARLGIGNALKLLEQTEQPFMDEGQLVQWRARREALVWVRAIVSGLKAKP